MDKKKKIISRILIIILILTGIIMLTNRSQALIFETIGIVGLGSILVYVIQLLILVFGLVLKALVTALTASVSGGHTAVTGIKSILFNENALTTAGYFANKDHPLGLEPNSLWEKGVMLNISENVTKYYYIIRNLSIAILLFVLLYIAIRMAISTVASEEAKYKKMLTNWVVSLATVFVLQYIMIITLYCNNLLVSTLGQTAKDFGFSDYASLAADGLAPIAGFGEALTFSILVGTEVTYLFMYIKRNITLGFLIVIAPLITVTYSIDKIADGKSQALNTWLKEFIFTVLVQPFHCIIYLVLVQSALDGLQGDDIGSWIIYIIMLTFMKEAENLVKKIFNIHTDSMPGAAAMGAMTMGIMTTLGGFGKGAGKGGGSDGSNALSKMPDMKKTDIENSTFSGKMTGIPDTTKGVSIPKANTKRDETSLFKMGATKLENSGDKFGNIVSKKGDEKFRELLKKINAGNKLIKSKSDGGNMLQDWAYRKASPLSRATSSFQGAKRFIGGKDGLNGVIKKGVQLGAAGAAFGLGLGMGDAGAAIGLATTAYGVANKVDGAIQEHKANVQLEDNERVFEERYKQYIEDYKSANVGATDDDAMKHFKQIMDQGKSYDVKNAPAYEKDFYENVYKNMKESYKVTGADKPDDNVEELIKKIMGN